jgi:WD40 repeat protein
MPHPDPKEAYVHVHPSRGGGPRAGVARSSSRVDAHARVLDVGVSPDGRRLATSGGDGSVKLWDAGTLALERSLAGHTAAVWS